MFLCIDQTAMINSYQSEIRLRIKRKLEFKYVFSLSMYLKMYLFIFPQGLGINNAEDTFIISSCSISRRGENNVARRISALYESLLEQVSI